MALVQCIEGSQIQKYLQFTKIICKLIKQVPSSFIKKDLLWSFGSSWQGPLSGSWELGLGQERKAIQRSFCQSTVAEISLLCTVKVLTHFQLTMAYNRFLNPHGLRVLLMFGWIVMLMQIRLVSSEYCSIADFAAGFYIVSRQRL